MFFVCWCFVLLCFLLRTENQNARGKPSQSREENQHTLPHITLILTWFTMVADEFPLHCVNSVTLQTGQISLGFSDREKRSYVGYLLKALHLFFRLKRNISQSFLQMISSSPVLSPSSRVSQILLTFLGLLGKCSGQKKLT